jgi:hypothetical protein
VADGGQRMGGLFTPARNSCETLEGFATRTLSEDDNKKGEGQKWMEEDNNIMDDF